MKPLLEIHPAMPVELVREVLRAFKPPPLTSPSRDATVKEIMDKAIEGAKEGKKKP
jgi:hypothetical protein